jgi:hypothetical protein
VPAAVPARAADAPIVEQPHPEPEPVPRAVAAAAAGAAPAPKPSGHEPPAAAPAAGKGGLLGALAIPRFLHRRP